ncbi:MAG: signal recognition particle protein [Planctomycetia bacterium]|nr:signal recognition particle protein [Planctomycetia bacterium]
MFESLTEKISGAMRRISGRGRISEANVRDALRDVRTALLEADVNYRVARDFVETVVQKAIGQEVIKSLRPEQVIVKIIHDEMIELMGPVDHAIPFQAPGPTVIMLAGLQGSGKTTTAAKLALYIERKGHRPLLVAADCQRPAAIEQLKVLGEQTGVPVYSEEKPDPVGIAKRSIPFARKNDRDVVIVDTAGRLHVDEEMMQEVSRVADVIKPHQVFLVCDAMTGQDAVTSAEEFDRRLKIDGVILTKLDGDARGGAALSIKAVTGKPIKFVGVGEKLDRIEEFHPDRMADRILGMGDVVTLVEKAQEAFDQGEAEKLQAKLQKGEFSLNDFLTQMRQMRKMGPLKDILAMIPGMGSMMKDMPIDEQEMALSEAMICSMTTEEREHPDVIDSSRRRRIGRGSGNAPQDVATLVKSFGQIRQMVQQMQGTGIFGGRRALKQQMSAMDLMGLGQQKKQRQRSKRKKKKRKKRSR